VVRARVRGSALEKEYNEIDCSAYMMWTGAAERVLSSILKFLDPESWQVWAGIILTQTDYYMVPYFSMGAE
jgi:hypothetical protein